MNFRALGGLLFGSSTVLFMIGCASSSVFVHRGAPIQPVLTYTTDAGSTVRGIRRTALTYAAEGGTCELLGNPRIVEADAQSFSASAKTAPPEFLVLGFELLPKAGQLWFEKETYNYRMTSVQMDHCGVQCAGKDYVLPCSILSPASGAWFSELASGTEVIANARLDDGSLLQGVKVKVTSSDGGPLHCNPTGEEVLPLRALCEDGKVYGLPDDAASAFFHQGFGKWPQ